jgi:hypothetical protein
MESSWYIFMISFMYCEEFLSLITDLDIGFVVIYIYFRNLHIFYTQGLVGNNADWCKFFSFIIKKNLLCLGQVYSD